MLKITAVTVCAALFTGAWGSGWSYDDDGAHGPDHWKDDNPACGMQRQSPIDIDPMEAEYSRTLTNFPFSFHGYDSSNMGLELTNNGHAAQVNIKEDDSDDIYIEGGGLLEPYHLAQYHFHWGSNSRKGSEHLVGGNSYPMEMHLVHYAESFGSLGDAATRPRGLAVLGFLFEVGRHNDNFDTIVNNLEQVREYTDDDTPTHDLPAFTMNSLLPRLSAASIFYRYEGSLTTPGCYESVVWTVFEDTIKVSEAQLDKFRELMEGEHHIQDNYRPKQALNGRVVTTNQMEVVEPPPSGSAVPFASVVVVLISAIIAKLTC